jgi:hypothetical protein
LGDLYREQVPEAEFFYPVELLRHAKQTVDVYPPTDTHWSRPGEVLVVAALLRELGLDEDADEMLRHYPGKEYEAGPYAGDLGSKLSPEVLGPRIEYPERFAKASFDNRFGGNLGITRLFVNPAAREHRRLLVFGDSFLNSCLPFLSDPFRYVLFVRTPFMHNDAVMMFKPTHIITGNVERYMCHVASDREAGCVLLAPVLRGHVLDPKNPVYQALDGVFSANGRGVSVAMNSYLTALCATRPFEALPLSRAWLASGHVLAPAVQQLLAQIEHPLASAPSSTHAAPP